MSPIDNNQDETWNSFHGSSVETKDVICLMSNKRPMLMLNASHVFSIQSSRNVSEVPLGIFCIRLLWTGAVRGFVDTKSWALTFMNRLACKLEALVITSDAQYKGLESDPSMSPPAQQHFATVLDFHWIQKPFLL